MRDTGWQKEIRETSWYRLFSHADSKNNIVSMRTDAGSPLMRNKCFWWRSGVNAKGLLVLGRLTRRSPDRKSAALRFSRSVVPGMLQYSPLWAAPRTAESCPGQELLLLTLRGGACSGSCHHPPRAFASGGPVLCRNCRNSAVP